VFVASRNLVVERLSSILLTCSWRWHVQYETTNVRCQKTVTCCLLNCATQTPVVHVLFLNMVSRMVLFSWLFLQECRRWHSTEPVTAQRASRVLLSPQWFSVHEFPARQRNVFCFWCDTVRGFLLVVHNNNCRVWWFLITLHVKTLLPVIISSRPDHRYARRV